MKRSELKTIIRQMLVEEGNDNGIAALAAKYNIKPEMKSGSMSMFYPILPADGEEYTLIIIDYESGFNFHVLLDDGDGNGPIRHYVPKKAVSFSDMVNLIDNFDSKIKYTGQDFDEVISEIQRTFLGFEGLDELNSEIKANAKDLVSGEYSDPGNAYHILSVDDNAKVYGKLSPSRKIRYIGKLIRDFWLPDMLADGFNKSKIMPETIKAIQKVLDADIAHFE
jgi:hypothetical protein